MRRAAFLACIAVLVCAGTAAAGNGPQPKYLPFTVVVPKHGKTALYAFKLTIHLPPGTTLSGAPPVSTQLKNGASLPSGLLAASAVTQTGSTTWEIVIAVDARKTSGPGAATLSGSVEVPPPLSTNSPELGKDPESCRLFLALIGKPVDEGAEESYWSLKSPSAKAKRVYTGVVDECRD